MAPPISYWATFNNVQFNTVPNLQIYAIDPYALPGRTLNLLGLARRSARKLSSAFYTSRQIQVSLYITASGRGGLDTALDTLYAMIQASEGVLVISQSGTQRQYFATYAGQKVNQVAGGFADITLTFECSDSFGYDTTYTPIFNLSNQSGPSLTYPYNQGGGADTQVPYIQIQYTALTGAASGTVTVGNQSTGQAVTITRTWSVNDILQIDCQNKTVQVNGADVNFSGAIPEFGLNAQTITYTDNFTTRLFKFFAYVYNRWN